MTRDAILKEFTVDEFTGRIENPGKFEREQVFAPYFYEFYLDGFGGEEIYIDETLYNCFQVTSEDLIQFPKELKGMFGVIMWENSQGFIFCKAFNEIQYKETMRALELDSEKEYAKL